MLRVFAYCNIAALSHKYVQTMYTFQLIGWIIKLNTNQL